MNNRRTAWFLAFAMLPMLTYMGHWQIPVSTLLPTAIFGEMAPHDHGTHMHSSAEQHTHSEHCHGDVASCSDIPYAGSATVVFLSYSVKLLALRATAWPQEALVALRPASHSSVPIPPPPRA